MYRRTALRLGGFPARLFLRIASITAAGLLTAAPILAQQGNTCPTSVLLDISRAASTCYGTDRDEICAGNGSVSGLSFDGSTSITQPGDRALNSAIQSLTLSTSTSAEEDLAIAVISAQGGLPTTSERRATILAFGDVQITNLSAPLPQINAFVTGIATLRSTPNPDAEILARVNVNDGLILNGRTGDNTWVRALVPDGLEVGWVTTDVLNIPGNVYTLNIAAAGDPVSAPFDVLELQTGGPTVCGDLLPSGVLVQSLSDDQPAAFQINGVSVEIRGTALITRQIDVLTVATLAGYSLITRADGDEMYIPAGAVGDDSSSTATPFDPASLAALPLMLLPASVRLPETITDAEIVRLTAAYHAAQAAAAATRVPPPTPDATVCRRVTLRAVSLYAGPGDFYEAINEMPAGESIAPILQTNDPDGGVWWQLPNSNWIATRFVRVTGECPEVPLASIIAPPGNNTLSLETCETTNGPLRSGQRVTIQFTPPAFQSYGEARDALTIDRGRITINANTYRTSATDPVRLGTVGVDDRYLRRFYITWTAEPGTFRIGGDRLSYEPICTITVPVG